MSETRVGREGDLVLFWCPGCDDSHQVSVEHPNGWGFNGDLERPTFTPSVLVHMTKWNGTFEQYGHWTRPTHPNVEPGGQAVCHSFVTDGRIQFLGDCTHGLAGQTVDLPPWRPLTPAPAGDSGDPCPKHRARGVNPECGDCDRPAPAGDSGGERG